MVGFNKISLLVLALLFIAGCVPSTKQTQCATNEAFNPTLRTCVPVVQTPSSFINISTTIPTSSFSRYKNDTQLMSFRVNVSNPYNQSYTTRWTDSYNGLVTNYTGVVSGALFWDVVPLFFQSQVGLHLLTVEILDSASKVVDSHSFPFSINELPRPVYDTTGWLPMSATPTVLTTSAAINFQSRVRNNGTVIGSTNDYYTEWVLSRNGNVLTTERDYLDTVTLNGTSTHLFSFNPAVNTPGEYVIRARLIVNSTSEVLDERQWFTSLAYPPSSKVISRDLISGQGYAGPVTAYTGVHYGVGAPVSNYNFTVDSAPFGSNRAQFCVKFADARGSVLTPEDNKFISVSFFLDGSGGAIYTGKTTAIKDEVCLTESGNTALTAILFNSAIDHTITARITDEASGREYTYQDLTAAAGVTYPLMWEVRVKPQNSAPIIEFGTTDANISCPPVGQTRYQKASCTVNSDTSFTVSANIAGDDFYFNTPSYVAANFVYTFKLYRDSVYVTQCTGTPVGYTVSCSLNIPSFGTTGPINVTGVPYTVVATVSDIGSPITSAVATSAEQIWNISVIESNTAPTVSSFTTNATSGSPVLERNSLSFALTVADAQMDNLTYKIQYCRRTITDDPNCLDRGDYITGSVTRTNNASSIVINESRTLPEDFLLSFTSLNCPLLLRSATCDIRFRAEVTDVPFIANPLTATETFVLATIANYNVAPTFDMTKAAPLTGVTYQAFVGFPFTMTGANAGFITDLSVPSSERVLRYQWYAKNSPMLVADYRPISGATGLNLKWTPSLLTNLANNPISLVLCVTDEPSVSMPTTTASSSFCSTPWTVVVKNNIIEAQNMAGSATSTNLAVTSGQHGTDTAIWYQDPKTLNGVTSRAAYVAVVANDNFIHVKRVLVQNDGSIVPDADTHAVRFRALPDMNDLTTPTYGVAAQDVKDLSITGDQYGLYVAYRASTALAPTTFYPQVRRLAFVEGKVAPNKHPSTFGFEYNGMVITASCSPSSECVVQNNQNGTTDTYIEFNPTANISGSVTIRSIKGQQVINFDAVGTPGTICQSCTGNTMAGNLISIINSSTSPELQGITASYVGSAASSRRVLISGSYPRDRLDLSPLFRAADQMGQIYVHGSNWYVPFIDGNRGGRLSVIRGATNAIIGPSNPIVIDTGNIDALGAASTFSNYYDGTDLYVALSTRSGNFADLYKLNAGNFAIVSSRLHTLSSSAVTKIQIAANASNAFVVGRVTGSPVKDILGIYDTSLVPRDQIEMTNLDLDPLTADRFAAQRTSSIQIIPYDSGARIISAATLSGGTDEHLYMAKVTSPNLTDWTMTCNDCNMISSQDSRTAPLVRMSAAPVRLKSVNDNYRLSQDGTIASEGIKDVVFLSFAQLDSAGTNANPAIGIFNLQSEQIEANTLFNSGSAGNFDAGLYRSPFVKN